MKFIIFLLLPFFISASEACSMWIPGCCSSKRVLEGVKESYSSTNLPEVIEEAQRVEKDTDPIIVFEFGRPEAIKDALNNKELDESLNYVRTVNNAIQGHLTKTGSEGLKNCKLNDLHLGYIRASFLEIERSHWDASADKKRLSVLSSVILNLINDLTNDQFDSVYKEYYVRDFNELMKPLEEEAKNDLSLLNGLKLAKNEFLEILSPDKLVNKEKPIGIIQKALKPFHISNISNLQEKEQKKEDNPNSRSDDSYSTLIHLAGQTVMVVTGILSVVSGGIAVPILITAGSIYGVIELMNNSRTDVNA